MRIRSTKPEFWRSPDTAALSYFNRLLFLGLWSYADDNGVGEDNINLIRSDLFPRDDILTVTELIVTGMDEIAKTGLIVRYRDSTNGRSYFWVTGWGHQKISHPTRSTKPLPTSPNVILLDSSGAAPEDSGAAPELTGNPPEPLRPEQGNKGTRERGNKGTREAADAVPPRPSMDLTTIATGRPAERPDPAPPDPRPAAASHNRRRDAERIVAASVPPDKLNLPAYKTACINAANTCLLAGVDELRIGLGLAYCARTGKRVDYLQERIVEAEAEGKPRRTGTQDSLAGLAALDRKYAQEGNP
jgi:hypothetical protein